MTHRLELIVSGLTAVAFLAGLLFGYWCGLAHGAQLALHDVQTHIGEFLPHRPRPRLLP